jgi:hypothetical protein
MRLEAALWYQQRKPGLGEEFVKEVDQAIRRVRENPLALRVIRRRRAVRARGPVFRRRWIKTSDWFILVNTQ